MSTTTKSQTEYGVKHIQYPINSIATITVKINYELIGDEISVGKPVWLLTNVTISQTPGFTVWGVSMQPANVYASAYGGTVFGFNGPSVNSAGQTVWYSSGLVVFNASGPFVATVTLTLSPTSATTWKSVDIPFYTSIPEISIAPSESNALFAEEQGLSLTFFFLSFVILTAGFILYTVSWGRH